MRLPFVIAAVALQALVLAYMAAEREWTLRHGRTVYLRTVPIDPRDVMRGDYVRLEYEISRVDPSLLRDGLMATNRPEVTRRRDQRVYASLHVKDDGLADLVSLSDQRPKEGLFLRGRLGESWGGLITQVRYGVEAYFMQQGQALELEQSRNRTGIQVPLEMEVSVGSSGLAVLKGKRWSPIGIGLALSNAPTAAREGNRAPTTVIGATVTLLNNSQQDLAIVDLPNGGSLALVPDARWGPSQWRWVNEGEAPPRPTADQVHVLKPSETYEMRVRFADARWRVDPVQPTADRFGRGKALSEITEPWGVRFRLVYRSPEREACRGLPNANLIWHGRLSSRAFTPTGTAD